MKALIFDLGETLVADEVTATTAFLKTCLFAQAHYDISLTGFQAIIRATCRSFWCQSPAREYCTQIGISPWDGLWAEFTGDDENLRILREWAPTYRRLSWFTALQKFGIEDEPFALKLAERYILSRQELHVVYRDVLPTLKRYKLRYRMGLLTNGVPDLQRRKIKGTGLGRFFDEIIVSGEFGIGKPDRKIFERMLSRFDVKPDSVLVVGDSLKSDVQGAHEVGMKAIWVNRSEEAPDDSIVPDFTVNCLDQLNEIINQVENV